MFVLKLVAKILLFPVGIIITLLGIIVKLWINIYSTAKGFIEIVMVAMIIGTVICYHDWIQVTALLLACVVFYLILFAGVFIDTMLDMAKEKIVDFYIS